jgi:HAE1 family hydrophobic/amphiphilic exporter-1
LLWLINALGTNGIIPPVPAMNINLFSLIGLILLVGLVTKNSILLVEFANQQRARGVSSRDAMLQAGAVRLRPILMTAFSTVAGILPIAIGFGTGAESRRPMGVAVVGGMLTSTFLTLLIIPVVYTLFSDFGSWLRRVWHREKPEMAAVAAQPE